MTNPLRLLLASLFAAAVTAGAPTGAYAPGYLLMQPAQTQGSGPWLVSDPWGNSLAGICANTTTQCLSEFLQEWAATGWPARIYGAPSKSFGPGGVWIEATSPVSVPAVWNASLYVDATVTLKCDVASLPCLTLDSQAWDTDFEWWGQIAYYPTAPIAPSPGDAMNYQDSCAVMVYPHTAPPGGQAAFYYGQLKFGTVYAVGGLGALCFDLEGGQVFSEDVFAGMLNGSNLAHYGLVVFNQQQSPPTGYYSTYTRINYIEASTVAGIEIGVTSAGVYSNNSNLFDLPRVEVSGGLGIHEWGQYDVWRFGLIPTNQNVPPNWGVIVQNTSTGDVFECGWVQLAAGSGEYFLDQGANTTKINCP